VRPRREIEAAARSFFQNAVLTSAFTSAEGTAPPTERLEPLALPFAFMAALVVGLISSVPPNVLSTLGLSGSMRRVAFITKL
jgi:hypothetical protein